MLLILGRIPFCFYLQIFSSFICYFSVYWFLCLTVIWSAFQPYPFIFPFNETKNSFHKIHSSYTITDLHTVFTYFDFYLKKMCTRAGPLLFTFKWVFSPLISFSLIFTIQKDTKLFKKKAKKIFDSKVFIFSVNRRPRHWTNYYIFFKMW